MTTSGSLSFPEFALAMFLTNRSLRSQNPSNAVPSSLPDSVRNEIVNANRQFSSNSPQSSSYSSMSNQSSSQNLGMGMNTNMGSMGTSSMGLGLTNTGYGMGMASTPAGMQEMNYGATLDLSVQYPAIPLGMNPLDMSGALNTSNMMGGAGVRWAVSNDEKAKYDQIFKAWDVGNSGYLSGDKARQVFTTSGLPQNILMHIWNLADIHGNGKLNADEFAVAMHLIYQKLNGIDLPQNLPPELVPPSHKDLDDSVSMMKEKLMGDLLNKAVSPPSLRKDYSMFSSGRRNSGKKTPPKVREDDEDIGYVSKHRRKPGTGASMESLESIGKADGKSGSERIEELERKIKMKKEILESLQKERELSSASAKLSTSSSESVESIKKEIRELHTSLKSLTSEFDRLSSEYNSRATSLRVLLNHLQPSSSFTTTLSTSDTAELASLKKQYGEIESDIASQRIELFKIKDRKQHKYSPIISTSSSPSLTSFIPQVDSSKPLTEEEKIKQKAAQMLAARLASLTGGSGAGAASGSSALSAEQKEALKRIESETKRIEDEKSSKLTEVDKVVGLGVGESSSGSPATDVLKDKENILRNMNNELDRLDQKAREREREKSKYEEGSDVPWDVKQFIKYELVETGKPTKPSASVDNKSTASSKVQSLTSSFSKPVNSPTTSTSSDKTKELISQLQKLRSGSNTPTSISSPTSTSFAEKPVDNSSSFSATFTSVEDELARYMSKSTIDSDNAPKLIKPDYTSSPTSPSVKSPSASFNIPKQPSPSLSASNSNSSWESSLLSVPSSATVPPLSPRATSPIKASSEVPAQKLESEQQAKRPDASASSSESYDPNAIATASRIAREKAKEIEKQSAKVKSDEEEYKKQHGKGAQSRSGTASTATEDDWELVPPGATNVTDSANTLANEPKVSVKSLASSLFGSSTSASTAQGSQTLSTSSRIDRRPSNDWLSKRSTVQVQQSHSSPPAKVEQTPKAVNPFDEDWDTSGVVAEQSASLGIGKENMKDKAKMLEGIFGRNTGTGSGGSRKDPNDDIWNQNQTVAESSQREPDLTLVKALYDYPGKDTDDLSFNENDYIWADMSKEDGEWWYGMVDQKNDKWGWFPKTYVEIESNSAGDHGAAGQTLETSVKAVALYDYTAAQEDEIGLTEGEQVVVVDGSDGDWWKIQKDGREGYVPATYVEIQN
ncbi:hypothetical protein BKA69DRAFT_1040851 [Paraphysoderma sedebokerense]|nr:hypothetical protein BKA69DRAFT_1040851 [Paraphysoderma sedebokerense]